MKKTNAVATEQCQVNSQVLQNDIPKCNVRDAVRDVLLDFCSADYVEVPIMDEILDKWSDLFMQIFKGVQKSFVSEYEQRIKLQTELASIKAKITVRNIRKILMDNKCYVDVSFLAQGIVDYLQESEVINRKEHDASHRT